MSTYRICLAVLGCVLALMLPSLAMAQSRADQAEATQHRPVKTRDVRTPLLSERAYRDLSRVYDQIGDDKYTEALQAINTFANRSGLSDYERATATQLRAHIYMALDRFPEALRDVEEVVRADVMPNHQHFQMMYQIASLNAMLERYEEALRALDRWLEYTDTVTADAFILRATSLAQLGRYREVIPAIDRALALRADAPDAWYQLKLAAHFELKQYPQAALVLEFLVERDPNRATYWGQLSSIYLAMDDQRRALSVMALAHRKALFDRESQWVQLYQLYSLAEVPYKAAQILEEGLTKNIVESTKKRWEDLGNAWYSAQELNRALAAYARAGALSADGKIDLQRGYILVDQEKWPAAEQALDEAIKKGGLDRPCNAYLLRGMAQFEQGKRQVAQQSFNRAATEERCRSAASQWLRHIEETRPRQQEHLEEEQVGPE